MSWEKFWKHIERRSKIAAAREFLGWTRRNFHTRKANAWLAKTPDAGRTILQAYERPLSLDRGEHRALVANPRLAQFAVHWILDQELVRSADWQEESALVAMAKCGDLGAFFWTLRLRDDGFVRAIELIFPVILAKVTDPACNKEYRSRVESFLKKGLEYWDRAVKVLPAIRAAASGATKFEPIEQFIEALERRSGAAMAPATSAAPCAPVQHKVAQTQVHGWITCDADSIVVRDGMYRCEVGWSNRPERPLPAPSLCVRVDVEVATQGADPNPRIAAIRTYSLNAKYERTDEHPPLTARQRELLRQYIDAEIPPYMLKMGGQAVVDETLAGIDLTAPPPRRRKPGRSQTANERQLGFLCRECGREVPAATVRGLLLRRVGGHWCQDCGSMVCTSCQQRKVAENASSAGLAGSRVEHLGKSYSYEDWYGEECQFCASQYQTESVYFP